MTQIISQVNEPARFRYSQQLAAYTLNQWHMACKEAQEHEAEREAVRLNLDGMSITPRSPSPSDPQNASTAMANAAQSNGRSSATATPNRTSPPPHNGSTSALNMTNGVRATVGGSNNPVHTVDFGQRGAGASSERA